MRVRVTGSLFIALTVATPLGCGGEAVPADVPATDRASDDATPPDAPADAVADGPALLVDVAADASPDAASPDAPAPDVAPDLPAPLDVAADAPAPDAAPDARLCGTPGGDCPPSLVEALVQSDTRVLLRFSEPLADGSAAAAYFSIAPPLAVTGAAFGATRDEVLLDTASQAQGAAYTVTARRADTDGDGAVDGRDQNVRDVAGNPVDAAARSATFTGMGAEVYAITDVMVSDAIGSVPPAYTGLSSAVACTGPYVPGAGTRVVASDVNVGIGGTTTGIFVRYARLRRDATTPVLTGLVAARWPDWSVSCPPGYVRASGTSGGRAGALTTGTRSDCQRIGLCARYEPLGVASSIVTNASLSVSGDPDAYCAPFCPANDGAWSMTMDPQDIHQGCGDGRWVRLCTSRAATRWPPTPARLTADDAARASLLAAHAPRVHLARGESYGPSSVEFAAASTVRFRNTDGRYWVRTREALATPSSTLPYFAGDVATAPVYAFWADKTFDVGGRAAQGVDLIYFLFFPYDRGKEVLGTVFGNHVGDWEHVSVRLVPRYDSARGWALGPDLFYVSIHAFGELARWDDTGRAGTHPVVYAAEGSHGLWRTVGDHTYLTLPGGTPLVDRCTAGAAWDTWNRMAAFDQPRRAGLAGATWPRWMSQDHAAAGVGDPAMPLAGAVWRWGNPEQGCVPALGVCRLENGPTGPVDKNVWSATFLQ